MIFNNDCNQEASDSPTIRGFFNVKHLSLLLSGSGR